MKISHTIPIAAGLSVGADKGREEAKTGRLVSVEAPASGCVVREVASPRDHANHLLYGELDGLEQTITLSSRNRQEAAGRMICGRRACEGREAVLFNETTPIYANGSGDFQTWRRASLRFPDRIEWRVHAAPDERDVLSGTMRVV
ncbi:hypothetical protein [Mesorhizobium sp. M0643]|uniref:hypothetical protein n=1 Tax=Mesorhizobium sp. M0643 TaxID=2956978 RepID=UPI0033360DFA